MATPGKVVAITGAASGIGRATAVGFGRQGARVALCDLNMAGLTDVATAVQRAGGETRVVELDVSNAAQATRAMEGIVQAWGRLDVLVNAAGINQSGPLQPRPGHPHHRDRLGPHAATSICSALPTVLRPQRGR